MIYVISKSTFGDYNVRDIQCNANWDCCPYSDYVLIPDNLVDGVLATKGYCDITLNAAGNAIQSFTARSIPSVPEECCGINTVLSVNGIHANNEGNVSLDASDVGAAPASHASNKSNPHGVTAAQVGARPDTWVPTAKELGFTGAVSTILSNDFATSRALVSNSSGKAASSSVTSTELGYLSGVTSKVQTQLDDRLQLTIGTAISSNSDLDTFKTPGKYYCGTGTIAGTLSNSPSSSTGYGLIVTDGYIKGRVYQIALMSNNSIRFRYFNGTTWQPWNTVLTNVLPSSAYGTSLPAAGTAGRIFFKKVSS